MIASQTEHERAVVRIHDEYLEAEAESSLSRLGRIVSDAYRRRMAQEREAHGAVCQVPAQIPL